MTHFGHKNIVKGCSDWADTSNCRDFATIEEHDAYILNEINKKVKPSDTLYHLGDFGLGFAWKDRLPELRQKINCETIRFIFGNHDHIIENAYRVVKKTPSDLREESNKKYYEAKKIVSLFKSADYLTFGNIGGRSMVLCHYAMRTCPWQNQGSIMLYGHSHGSLPDDPNMLSFDIGVDTCLFGHEKYTPYSIDEIYYIADNHKKFVPIDHHR